MTELTWLPDPTRARIDQAVAAISNVLGKRVRSILLVGPAVHEDRPDRAMHPELLVVVDELQRGALEAVAAAIRPFIKKGMRFRTVTEEELRGSVDVHALEISEWKHHHVRLQGDDLLDELEPTREHLRLDLERALRGLGRRVRDRLMQSMAMRSRDLDEVLRGALDRLVVIAGHGLRYSGQEPPDGERATLKAFLRSVEAKAGPTMALYDRLRAAGEASLDGPTGELRDIEAALRVACKAIDRADP